MEAPRLEIVYASTSSNRNENNISSSGRYLLYSRSNRPILYDLHSDHVIAELIGHEDLVNGQSFVLMADDLRNNQLDNDQHLETKLNLISSSYDKTAIIWEIVTKLNHDASVSAEHRLLFHIKSPVGEHFTTRCSMKLVNGNFITVTTNIEGDINLWQNDKLLETIAGGNCCFDSKFYCHTLDQSDVTLRLLFLAGGDNQVHIYQVTPAMKLHHLLDIKGFNDWVKCVDIMAIKARRNEFLLATACQDCYIRIWDINLTTELPDKSQIRTNFSSPLELETKSEPTYRLSATLETILSGHDGIVHGVEWFKGIDESLLQLISCSEDKTIVVWRSRIAPQREEKSRDFMANNAGDSTARYESAPASADIWKEVVRVGETGETNLPFLGVCLSEDQTRFYGQSLHGAIHSWAKLPDLDEWEMASSITGHFGAVSDLAWEAGGRYLLSSSSDKTCRMHALSGPDHRWHEIARPQVHGHEINCLASISFQSFASGAEEKTIRTFGATKFFLKNFNFLTGEEPPPPPPPPFEPGPDELEPDRPEHAQLPALGLSNKGAACPYDIEVDNGPTSNKKANMDDWTEISNLVKQLAKMDHLSRLPCEELLLQSTLWWERNKIYGHCNEVFALASDSRGSFIASSCKANRADLAKIFFWETSKFRRAAVVEHHSLTITRLKFSPDDRYLLSVSRDRTWCLSRRSDNLSLRNAFKKLIGIEKSQSLHERIIWDCCWTHDSRYFVTVSRDKKAQLWSLDHLISLAEDWDQDLSDGGQVDERLRGATTTATATTTAKIQSTCIASKSFDCSIQAVDSSSESLVGWSSSNQATYLFALGFEDGSLKLANVVQIGAKPDNFEWQLLSNYPNFHQMPITRLAFKPKCVGDRKQGHGDRGPEGLLWLASGSADCVVKLATIEVVLVA